MFNFMKKKEEPKQLKMQPFTLAGVTFNNRQELIKHLKFREELSIEEWEYEGKPAFKVLNSNGFEIGNIRQSDVKSMQKIYTHITKSKVLGTNAFVNEDGETIISCQIGVEYYD